MQEHDDALHVAPPTHTHAHHVLWICDDNTNHIGLCCHPVCSFLSYPLVPHSIFSPP